MLKDISPVDIVLKRDKLERDFARLTRLPEDSDEMCPFCLKRTVMSDTGYCRSCGEYS